MIQKYGAKQLAGELKHLKNLKELSLELKLNNIHYEGFEHIIRNLNNMKEL